MDVECARMGCPHQATVLLAYDPRSATAWLRDLVDAHPSLGLALCGEHAERTSVPMGWSRIDERRPAWQSFDDPDPFSADPFSADPFGADPVEVVYDRDDLLMSRGSTIGSTEPTDQSLTEASAMPSGGEPPAPMAEPDLEEVDQSFAARSRARLRRIEEMAFRSELGAPASSYEDGPEQWLEPDADVTAPAASSPVTADRRETAFDGVEVEDIEDEDFEAIFGIPEAPEESGPSAASEISFEEPQDVESPGASVAEAEDFSVSDDLVDTVDTVDTVDSVDTDEESIVEDVPAVAEATPRRVVDEYDEANVSFEDIFPSRVASSPPDHDDFAAPSAEPPPIQRISRVERSTDRDHAEPSDETLFPDHDFSTPDVVAEMPTTPVASAGSQAPQAPSAPAAPSGPAQTPGLPTEARPEYLPNRQGASARLNVDGAVSPLLGRAFGFVQRH